MKNIKEMINFNIIIAESIKAEKQDDITKLEARLITCPGQWLQQTKRFIEVIKANILERGKLISKLHSMEMDQGSSNNDVSIITAKLNELDVKDNMACDIYKAVMDEGIISKQTKR